MERDSFHGKRMGLKGRFLGSKVHGKEWLTKVERDRHQQYCGKRLFVRDCVPYPGVGDEDEFAVPVDVCEDDGGSGLGNLTRQPQKVPVKHVRVLTTSRLPLVSTLK
jgi:hypothetical protein